MELYEYARPGLMAGKKLLYVHGFASSGQTGSAKTLRLLLPDATVLSPDLPVEPSDAMLLLMNILASEKPDLIIGSSMGGMYAEMLYGIDRILVNPAFQLADTLLKNNGLGRQEFHNLRQDGETSFLVTKSLLEHFRDVSSHCFERAAEDQSRVFGLYGIHDNLVHTFDLFSEHYPQAIRFDGEHHLNDAAILHAVLPVIQWIYDRQNGVHKPVLFIALSDKLISHSSGFGKAVSVLSRNYDLHIVAGVPYNTPEQVPAFINESPGSCGNGGSAERLSSSVKCGGYESKGFPMAEDSYSKIRLWCEENLGVPVWNRVTACNHKNLLLADYLIDAEPEVNGGGDFLGTLIPFGSDAFKTWDDILTYFSRLGGQ